MKEGPSATPVGGIGDIVVVPPVKQARDRGDLASVRPFARILVGRGKWSEEGPMTCA